jgi:hypothetical protein
MPVEIQAKVGPLVLADGSLADPRLGKAGELIVQEFHGRFYEQTYRGNVYGFGNTLTAINNATFTTATLGATATPVLGLWNPANSPVNLVLLQAALALALTALQATGGGPFVWAASTGNAVITTGSAPFNRKTLAQVGSQAKAFAPSTALTGLTNNLVLMEGSEMNPAPLLSLAFLQTAAGALTPAVPAVQNFDGSLIVPPGGVIALLATTTPIANSTAGRLLWEEVPV